MRLRWVSWSLLFVGLACSSVVVLTPQEQADVVASAIEIPGGDRVPGPPPPENDDAEHIQIRHLTAPALLQPGQAFVIHVQTDVEDPDRVSGAALAITDAPDHILVSSLPPLRQIFKAGGEVWWGLDVPARFGEPDGGLTRENFEFRLALLDENGEAGNYFAWTVWAGDQGPTCPDDAACGSQECGVDPVCGTPCGTDAGGCGDAGICEFFGTCIDPDPMLDSECLSACAQDGLACGLHPELEDCACPSSCEGNTTCQVNDCVGPASECTGPADCEANEDCMDGSCNRIACGEMLPCPSGTSCVNDFCELGCSLDDPSSCPPGSQCEAEGGCVPLDCELNEVGVCPQGSFCDGTSSSCVAHECDLANPEVGCPDGQVCRIRADLSGEALLDPATCQEPGDVPTGGICTSNPENASHDCNAADVCWNPSLGTGAASRCIERCVGQDMAQCGGETVCDPVVPGLLHLCLETCDPLGVDPCAGADEVCVPSRHRDYAPPLVGFGLEAGDFVCKPHDASQAAPLALGQGCDEPSECAEGLTCAPSEADCGGPMPCCVPFCIESVDCGSPTLECGPALGYAGNPAVGECTAIPG